MLGVSREALRRSYQWSPEITEKLPECAALIEKFLTLHRRRYRRLASLHVVWFKVIGAIEIVLSITLPLLFVVPIIQDEQKNYVFLAIVSVVVAIAAGLRNFYSWDTNWRLYRSQEFILAGLVAQWEIEMLRLLGGDPAELHGSALDETAVVIARLTELFEHENSTLFNAVVPPESVKKSVRGLPAPPTTTTAA
ncbi:SLATT domain-containing protein [Micromonospora chersina]|uniref:SLATT domain-containing protein n=1 Tax=Micromonospora chersina TaxID=47854 RepID=UPI003722BFB9